MPETIKSKESVTYYSGTDSSRGTGGGVGFSVKRAFVETVAGFVTISQRVCNIRIRKKFKNTSLINIYAPTEKSEDDAKDAFNGIVEDKNNKIPNQVIKQFLEIAIRKW